MFKTDKLGKMPIDEYMDNKEANDLIKKFFAVAGTAPSKTRGSFVAAALSTLQMFVFGDTSQKHLTNPILSKPVFLKCP